MSQTTSGYIAVSTAKWAGSSPGRPGLALGVLAAVLDHDGQQHSAIRAQRHLAVAADAELRRRHPEQRFTPLRSAEPQAATDAQRAELALTAGQDMPEAGQWIKDLAAGRSPQGSPTGATLRRLVGEGTIADLT